MTNNKVDRELYEWFKKGCEVLTKNYESLVEDHKFVKEQNDSLAEHAFSKEAAIPDVAYSYVHDGVSYEVTDVSYENVVNGIGSIDIKLESVAKSYKEYLEQKREDHILSLDREIRVAEDLKGYWENFYEKKIRDAETDE